VWGYSKDHRGFDLISDALPFGRLWYGEPDAASNAVGYAKAARRTKPFHEPIDLSGPSSDPLELALTSARRAEQQVSILLKRAIEEGEDWKILSLLIAYNKAAEGRLNVEKLYRAEVERRQNLIPIKTAAALAAKGLNVMVARIQALPNKNGSLVNPQHPDQATTILDAECKNMILDAEKSCPKELSAAVRWPNISQGSGW
jgi:hypothetical protein